MSADSLLKAFFSISISGRPDNDERLSVTSLEASVIRSVKCTNHVIVRADSEYSR